MATLTETPVAAPSPRWTLGTLFRRYRGRILLTYGLFTVENVLSVLQPSVLGLAIDGLLRSSYYGLALFVAQHLGYTLIGCCRRAYDIRAFTSTYTDLATQLVTEQRQRGVDTSRVAARSALSRAFVDFFEHDVPIVLRSLFSLVGALVLLAFYDPILVLFCVALLLPASVLNVIYGRKTLLLSGRLHDELEREVGFVDEGRREEVRGHYSRVARWRIRLTDWEAWNFGLMELFILGLLAAVLARYVAAGAGAGDVFAVFRYTLMFVMGLDNLPQLVQQVSRLRDIGRRMEL